MMNVHIIKYVYLEMFRKQDASFRKWRPDLSLYIFALQRKKRMKKCNRLSKNKREEPLYEYICLLMTFWTELEVQTAHT